MSDLVKELAPQILAEIQKSKSILLHLHPSPDPDSAGSVLAMMHYLKSIGKDVVVIAGDTPKKAVFNYLPGYDQVVDKTYIELDKSKVDLFLILDSGGLNLVSSLGVVEFPNTMMTIVIDHHSHTPSFGKLNLIVPTYPAVGEIIYDLFRQWRVKITPEMAKCLYLAIYADSGGFRFSLTKQSTYLAAAELVKIYPDFWKGIAEMETITQEGFKFKNLVLNSVKTFFNGRVAIGGLNHAQLAANKIDPENVNSSDIVNEILSVQGWDLVILMNERDPKVCSLSFRTRVQEEFDVSNLARSFGGGGHKAAAGAKIEKHFDEALKLLCNRIEQVYPQLGKP